ncbi:MAG: flagellar export chaperone FliS [bacterium]
MPVLNPYKQYDNVTFGTADPMSLVIVTYDAAIRSLKEVVRCLKSNDIRNRVKNVDLSFELISELRKSLNPEKGGEIAEKLNSLYEFFIREITMANAYQDADRLDPVIKMLQELRDGWVEVRKQVTLK